MKFRPCIDIHNGSVKQIVGGSLKDEQDQAEENFVAEQDAAYFAGLYQRFGLTGGHIILLNPPSSGHFEATREQAVSALRAYPGGLQIGGGITDKNARFYLDCGASHVIVTSYVFRDGTVNYENLNRLQKVIGTQRLVLDLSCRRRDGAYYIVTDRWQKYTDVKVTTEQLKRFSGYCDEFLIHGVDVEGKADGIEEELAEILGAFDEIPVTYAGGIGSFEDLDKLYALTDGNADVTIGSALDLFGGTMKFEDVLRFLQDRQSG